MTTAPWQCSRCGSLLAYSHCDGCPEADTYGIAETKFNEWEVRQFRNGFLHTVIASALPKREAQRIRDEHMKAREIATANCDNRSAPPSARVTPVTANRNPVARTAT